MPKYPPLTVKRHISFDGGKHYTDWEDLTPEQQQAAAKGIANKLGECLQRMIDHNPALYDVLREKIEEDERDARGT